MKSLLIQIFHIERKVKEMTNTAKLKAVIVEKGMLQEQVAMQLGMTSATFNYKVNNKTEFKASEIKKLSKILKLTDDEVIAIFFA